MTQFYSRNDVNYSGDVYSIPFDYIDKKEVKVYIDDELWTEWHFLNKHQLTLDEVPAEIGYSNIISVRRETDIEEKVVTYDNNSLLNKENLNKSQDQLLFAVQEIYDNNVQFQSDIREEVDEKVERVSDAVEKLEFLEDSVAIANEAALEATEQAQIATEKAEETLNTYNEAMAEIDILRQDSIDEVNQLVADHTNDLNSLDATIKKDADAIINRVGFSLFDTVLKDHVLTYEESKGLALQGTYVYKTAVAGERYGYPDFYAKCLEEKDLGEVTEVTLGNYTITMYLNANGHKFYDIADKEAIDAWFETYGTCWYYGIDTENERIYLPRNIWFEQLTADSSEVGSRKTAGLPNITGSITGAHSGQGIFRTTTGAFTLSSGPTQWGAGGQSAENTSNNYRQANFDASRSNAIYGKSNTVQPNAVKKLLYICVGNTVSDTSWVDVVTQVANGAKDIEDKRVQALKDLNNKENAGLSALANASNALRETQITNCIKEIPQRIKYTLEDGTLTIKAGSVVIVPYGTEDLTSQYPNGATFIHENFKVVDTQFADGKFFVWAEVVSDVSRNYAGYTAINLRPIHISITENSFTGTAKHESGSEGFTGSSNCLYYHTNENLVKYYKEGSLTNTVHCLPLLTCTNNENYLYAELKQVFNGFGYIGSTAWADKGIKFLSANGRNIDGTLKNLELETPKVLIRTNPIGANLEYFYLGTSRFIDMNKGHYFEQEEEPQQIGYALWYKPSENIMYFKGAVDTPWYTCNYIRCSEATAVSTGEITSFNPKETFRAVDYNEFSNTPHITQTYVNGTSWYRVYSDGWCEQGGRVSINYSHTTTTITLLKKFKDTNYNIQLSHGGFANSGVLSPNWQSLTTSSFVLYADYSNDKVTAPTTWQACGYIA